jgi:hypothetical protein
MKHYVEREVLALRVGTARCNIVYQVYMLQLLYYDDDE